MIRSSVAAILLILIFSTGTVAQPGLTARADSLSKAGADVLVVADAYNKAWQYDRELTVLEISGRQDVDVLWRKARGRIDIGEKLSGDVALKLFENAEKEAARAVGLDSTNANAQQMLAIALGRVALHKGVFSSIGLVKRIYPAAQKAIALNDSMPRCYYIIGRLHQELTAKPAFALSLMGLGWAREDSISWYYDKALQINPGLIQTRVSYAEYLMKDKRNPDMVQRLLEQAVMLPVIDEQDVKAKEEARELKRINDR